MTQARDRDATLRGGQRAPVLRVRVTMQVHTVLSWGGAHETHTPNASLRHMVLQSHAHVSVCPHYAPGMPGHGLGGRGGNRPCSRGVHRNSGCTSRGEKKRNPLPPRLVQATLNDQKLTDPTPSARVLLRRRILCDARIDMMYCSEKQEVKHATKCIVFSLLIQPHAP